MIPVSEARTIIKNNLIEFNTKVVDLMDAGGCVIAEDVFADRDFPPFERVTMDGIAIDSDSLNGGQKEFVITHLQPAGAEKTRLTDNAGAIEIMTGAILPENTDAVIRYEDLDIVESDGKRIAKVKIPVIDAYKNIHRQGEDKKTGDLLIKSGTLLSSPELAVLATTGKSRVIVFEFHKTAIISTGDELVEVSESPLEHQIRKSNIHAIQNELMALGIEVKLFHLADSKELIENELKSILEEFPVIILSGGVSKGKLDFVPEVLEKSGISKHFHRVAQRPGKPLWFGSSSQNVVFALPGNPVSTFMCFIVFVREWFLNCLDLSTPVEYAVLDSDASFVPNLTYFMQVSLSYDEDAKLIAKPVQGHGSGDLTNLLNADGFLELPVGQTIFRSGTSFPVHRFRRSKATSEFNHQ